MSLSLSLVDRDWIVRFRREVSRRAHERIVFADDASGHGAKSRLTRGRPEATTTSGVPSGR